MPEIKENITIPKHGGSHDDFDYSFLRKKGLEFIEHLSNQLWTDYNSHDPGITILEMLCYAITDLGQRMSMPMESILAPQDSSEQSLSQQFFRASQILPSAPVTENDYRKLFIDIDGVENCWLKPFNQKVYVDCRNKQLTYSESDIQSLPAHLKGEFSIKGLYSVIVELSNDIDADEQFPVIKEEIFRRYHANRNLCEDLVEVIRVKTQPIGICASIELLPDADDEQVHANILYAIDNYFAPKLKFHSLSQMLDRGYTSEQIFEGPLLNNGFIDDKELEGASLRTEIRLSDIIQIIMRVEGVKLINDITINDCSKELDDTECWLLCVDNGKKPFLCEESVFNYNKGLLRVHVDEDKYKEILADLKNKEEERSVDWDVEFGLPVSEYQAVDETTTIQNDFPDTYGIGLNGLPQSESTARKAKAKQLKGYLLFFDQVLANYFAHLGQVKDLLSVDNKLSKTWFAQAVKDIKDFGELVTDYPLDDQDQLTDSLFAGMDKTIERRNRILNHLLARFAERFTDYAFLMKQLYGERANKAVLNSKVNFLKDYHTTSSQRGCAFNYYKQPEEQLWNTNNVGGIEKRIARLAGMKDYSRRNLSEMSLNIYSLTNSKGELVYRWQMLDSNGKIILSATESYLNPLLAKHELTLAILRIVETPEGTIEHAFNNPIAPDSLIGNFLIRRSASGRYTFNIVDHMADPKSKDWIVARRFAPLDNQEELKRVMLDLKEFVASEFTEEGIFVLEHILLRPNDTETTVPSELFMPICISKDGVCSSMDPYSYQVTIVLPGWTYRFMNPEFRNFLEDLIRKELPAHVLARICWVGNRKGEVANDENDMLNFEEKLRQFLLAKTNLGQEHNTDTLEVLIITLGQLNNIYPSGKLIDCYGTTDNHEGRVVLGRTNIGNL